MLASAAKIDITPERPVWMDGMIRAHQSVGVHDPLHARALVLANSRDPADMFAVVSIDVCGLTGSDSGAARDAASAQTGIPTAQVIVACTHTHSGPATIGYFNASEPEYTRELVGRIAVVVEDAVAHLRPAAAGCASGREETISHYRRLLADDGHVVMNWEPYPAEHIVGPLGRPETEVGVLKVAAVDDPSGILGILFNHSGHPNVMSGDNYLLSADYPGVAMREVERQVGGLASFVNGAQGTMDIDGLRHRDWDGVERAGTALAEAVVRTANGIEPSRASSVRGRVATYSVPTRRITTEEWAWAQEILRQTGGKVAPLADGIGDDYKAVLYRELRAVQDREVMLEQTCFVIDDTAFITFPGELYTEIGIDIKARSPFARTYIIGLANGDVGYVPTRKAIGEGGYAEDTRRLDDSAEDIVVEQSLALLRKVKSLPPEE